MRHCDESPPEELLRAVVEFNRGDWFDCHETLEDLWVAEEGETRDFYHGVLQVAVALHHWREGNFGGAVRLLEGGAKYLRRVQPVCQGVDVAGLVAAADRLREALTNLGAARMAELHPDLIPRLRLVNYQ
jgi:predicted metal-dependent hydrolase